MLEEAAEARVGEVLDGASGAEPSDAQAVVAGETEGELGEFGIARCAAAAVAEGEVETAAEVAVLKLSERPGVVLGGGEGFIEGQAFPEGAAEHAHAVAVKGAEAEAFVLEFGPAEGVAVKRVVVPFQAGAGDGGVQQGGDHLGESVRRVEDGVGAEDEAEIGAEEVEAEVEDSGVGVGSGPVDDPAAGGADEGRRGVGAAAVDAEDDAGLEGLPTEGGEHGGQGGGGVGEADEDAEGGRGHGGMTNEE